MNAELKSKKWLFAGIGLQIGVGYSLGFLAFFFGSLIAGTDMGESWMPVLGWSMVLIFAAVLAGLILRKNRELKKASF